MTQTLSVKMRIKHRLATSPLADPLEAARTLVGRIKGLRHPELGLLRQESQMAKACLARIVKPDWNCLDVGAHIGSVSYDLMRLAPRGKLMIIEALPQKAAALRTRFPNAIVHEVAVGPEEGIVTFSENLEHSGFSSLSNRQSRGRTRDLSVRMARIDTLWPQEDWLHFIKIDVEGHEFPALRGAIETLKRCQPVILFEAGAESDPDLVDADQAGLYRFLVELGYKIRPVFHQYYGREPVSAEGFAACRRYPFTAFNFVATSG